MQELNKDDNFSKLMLKSKLHLHSEELEDKIMQQIIQKELYEKRVYKNIKISISFLILTIILGFILNNKLYKENINSINLFSNYTTLLFQIMLVSAFLFLTNNLIKFFKEIRKRASA